MAHIKIDPFKFSNKATNDAKRIKVGLYTLLKMERYKTSVI